MLRTRSQFIHLLFAMVIALGAVTALPRTAVAQVTALKQSIAESAARHDAVAAFYRERNYEPLWTSKSDSKRRRALFEALDSAAAHGLPEARYDAEGLKQMYRTAKSARDLGKLEVQTSRVFLQFAQDLQTGALTPGAIDDGIKRRAKRRDQLAQLVAFSQSTPSAYMRALQPKSVEYKRLMAEKMRLERLLGTGGWGDPVSGVKKLEPGDAGAQVVDLRNRLIRMGYLKRSAAKTYDATLQKAVQEFQLDHGLLADGIAGSSTIEELNVPVERRLAQVISAMERERWLGDNRGRRHVLVNITDFHAQIIENDKVAFRTRSVVGANTHDRQTPEFSDTMEHMVINPTWNVPKSIATKEYLPLLQKDPSSVSHLKITDERGQLVDRTQVDFTQFSTSNFPFDMKQPPSNSNALGLVKFMFPNRHNIYLHDTPHKSLFGRESRAFSHGCIRLNDPFDFAYELLGKQETDPVGFFRSKLSTGLETTVPLDTPLPVHIIYRTAFTQPKGRVQYRRDVYGRDAKIFAALQDAGVVLRAVRG